LNKPFAIGLALSMAASGAFAQAITPSFTTFGALPGANFGGSGIPNTDVAITTYSSAAPLSALTLGLSTTTRCAGAICGAAVSNNGAATFTVQAEAPFAANPGYAGWNIDYYAQGNSNLYNFKLFYDFNPALANGQNTHGVFNLFTVTGSAGTGGLDQNSSNMGFASLATSVPGVIAAPSFSPFNPNASGQYTFALIAFDKVSGAEVARSAMLISAVPEASSYAMLLAGLAGIGGWVRRRQAAL
jgi:hypothetical protein